MILYKYLAILFLFLLSFSFGSFVKRSGDLISNPGESSSLNHPTQTPPAHPNTPAQRVQEQNGRRNPVDRPPELPASHPIGPSTLPEVRYEEDRQRPNLFQRLTGIKGKGKKRTRYEMENDHEAGTSGTKEPNQVNKKPKANAEDVYNFCKKVVEDRNRETSCRRNRYRSLETIRRERESLKGIVGLGLAVTGSGVAKVYNAGKRAYGDIKEACVGACRRVDQRIQRYFESKGWSEPSQPLRPGVQRYPIRRSASWQLRQEIIQGNQKGIDEAKKVTAEQKGKGKQNVLVNQQQPSSVSTSRHRSERSQSAPPTFRSKNTLDRSLHRSHSSPF